MNVEHTCIGGARSARADVEAMFGTFHPLPLSEMSESLFRGRPRTQPLCSLGRLEIGWQEVKAQQHLIRRPSSTTSLMTLLRAHVCIEKPTKQLLTLLASPQLPETAQHS